MTKLLISVCLCLIFIIGCSKTETTKQKEVNAEKTEKTLKIGLSPEHNIFNQISRYQPLAEYLSKKTGIQINLEILTRYGNIVDNFKELHLDGAFFGSFTYTLAHERLNVEVLARPENFNSISTYYGLIVVRGDSGIKTIEDMKSKIFVFVDKATTAGYLFPLAYFKNNGIKDYKTYLKETYFAGTHEDAIFDVLNKKADIGAAKNTVFNRISFFNKRINNELVIIERSPEVPENSLAVRKDLDSSIKNKLRDALLNMHNDRAGIIILKEFGAQRFIKTIDSDYSGVYKYTKEINLDLTTYDYKNY